MKFAPTGFGREWMQQKTARGRFSGLDEIHNSFEVSPGLFLCPCGSARFARLQPECRVRYRMADGATRRMETPKMRGPLRNTGQRSELGAKAVSTPLFRRIRKQSVRSSANQRLRPSSRVSEWKTSARGSVAHALLHHSPASRAPQ